MAEKIPVSQMGCWLDGSQGWHNSYRVIDRAEEWGMKVENADRIYVYLWRQWRGSDMPWDVSKSFEEEYDTGHIDDLVSQATEYLDSLAPEGYAFHWDMGELSLLCLCQIEGTEENVCDKCKERR